MILRIAIAMALGVGAGFVLPEWAASVFSTFNGLFSGFLGFIIPLLIVGFVAPAIAEVGCGAGRMLAVTALLAYLMTFASGLLFILYRSVDFSGTHSRRISVGRDGSRVRRNIARTLFLRWRCRRYSE